MIQYIVLALLGLLALLLFLPVKAEAVWRKGILSLRLRLLWLIPITLLPQKEKPEKPKKEKKPKPPRPQKEPRPKKDTGEAALEILQLVNDLLPRVGEFFGRLTRGIVISRCRIALVVSGEEADAVGVACGRAYALGYGAYSVLSGMVRIKEFVYNVMPDFLSGEGAADVEVTAEVRPVTLLAAGSVLLFHLAKTLLGRQRPESETIRR